MRDNSSSKRMAIQSKLIYKTNKCLSFDQVRNSIFIINLNTVAKKNVLTKI